MTSMHRNKQSVRSLTAFIVTWAFIVLMVTGTVLYIVPHGRVAYWTHWSLASMGRDQWGWVHMMFGGVFIIAGSLHLYFNWKPFKQYIADRVQGHLRPKREVLLATAATAVIFLVSAFDLPPASWVIDLNSRIKDAWVTSPELEPPFGHAEQASLAGLSRRMDLDPEKAQAELRANGVAFDGPGDTLEQIARRNEMTPMAVYALIRRHAQAPAPLPSSLTPAEIEARFMGTGLGRKTLTEVCDSVGLDPRLGIDRLAQAGISARPDDRLKPLADANGMRPMDLLVILLQAGGPASGLPDK